VIEVRDSYPMYSIYRANCLVTISSRTLLDIEDVLDMMLLYRYMHVYEYNTLHASVCVETDFWTGWRYYFSILALMSLTDGLVTLSILTTRGRGELDSMLIEDVTLLSYDFD